MVVVTRGIFRGNSVCLAHTSVVGWDEFTCWSYVSPYMCDTSFYTAEVKWGGSVSSLLTTAPDSELIAG